MRGGFGARGLDPGCTYHGACDRGFTCMSGGFCAKSFRYAAYANGLLTGGLCLGIFCPRGLWSDGFMSEGI